MDAAMDLDETPGEQEENKLKDRWKLLEPYIQSRGLVRQHIESYDYFVTTGIQKIIEANSEIKFEGRHDIMIKLKTVSIGKPCMQEDGGDQPTNPQMCRLRNLSYTAPINVVFDVVVGQQREQHKSVLGRMPVMLRSCKCTLTNSTADDMTRKYRECLYDPGGYFIIKGKEKVILIQEQLAKNRIIVTKERKQKKGPFEYKAAITSKTVERTVNAHLSLKKDGYITLNLNQFTEPVPICIIFKAMGIESDQEIVQIVGSDVIDDLVPSLRVPRMCKVKMDDGQIATSIKTKLQALTYVGNKKSPNRNSRIKNTARGNGEYVIKNFIVHHVGSASGRDDDYSDKVLFLGAMVRKLLLAKRNAKDKSYQDDKDYYGNKRLELAGHLLDLLFQDLIKQTIDNITRGVDATLSKRARAGNIEHRLHTYIDHPRVTACITNGLSRAISSGNWTLKRFRMDRAGITQGLSRLSYISAVGHMTRIQSSVEKTRKTSGPRSLQPSQWGMVCPADTPEGQSCGLDKNLALMAHVTTEQEAAPIRQLAYSLGVEELSLHNGLDYLAQNENVAVVHLNGLILGIHNDPRMLVEKMRQCRRKRLMSPFTSICYVEDKQRVTLASDVGRVCRPLYIVDQKTRRPLVQPAHLEQLADGRMTFDDFQGMGLIEYLDVNEENDALIALDLKNSVGADGLLPPGTTHLEISPMTVLGAVCGLVPYPHHNQSPRNTYQCAMGKQAMGTIGLNCLKRTDKLLYLLLHPHKPMVASKTLKIINFNDMPAGQNATLAVMSYSGYDIEDAIIMNQASLDRGFGRCFAYKTLETPLEEYKNDMKDRLLVPTPAINPQTGEKNPPYELRNQSALDLDGVARPGAMVRNNFQVVLKQVPKETETPVMSHGEDAYQTRPTKYKMKTDVDQWSKEWGPAGATERSPLRPGNERREDSGTHVDRVVFTSGQSTSSPGHCPLLKAVMREFRRPELGDKFSSRHGQKGVCGLIVPQEDMPFNQLGMCPDIIMNPHGFPSRMTVGKMIELLAGKAGLFEGKTKDGTAFEGDPVDACSEELVRNGFSYVGKDCLTSGITGEPLEVYIYMGPVYYQKLKHMVIDKMHARSTGPKAMLTRQPMEGRSKEGGLRLGEMERDCMLGHGAAMLLHERLMDASDAHDAFVCQRCGFLCYQGNCQYCKNGESVAQVRMPYAFKLLLQELMSMNIAPRLTVEPL